MSSPSYTLIVKSLFFMLFPGYAVLRVRHICLFPLPITKKQTRPEITKISRNSTAPNPTQHTSLPDVTQGTSLRRTAQLFEMPPSWSQIHFTEDLPCAQNRALRTFLALTNSLHPPQPLARETNYIPPYRLAQMVKNPPAMQKALCSNQRRFDSCVRKIPWRKEWQPTPEFLPEEFHEQRSLAGSKRVRHD